MLKRTALNYPQVQYGTIKGILPYNFANSSTLETISLARNSIEHLEQNAFADLPALQTLDFGEVGGIFLFKLLVVIRFLKFYWTVRI